MSTYFVDELNDEPWLFVETGQHNCAGGGEWGHERYCGIEPVVSIADVLTAPSLRTEYAVRYRDTATVYMSGEIAYHYSGSFSDTYRAGLMLEQVKKRGRDREDAVIAKRQVTEWKVESDE